MALYMETNKGLAFLTNADDINWHVMSGGTKFRL